MNIRIEGEEFYNKEKFDDNEKRTSSILLIIYRVYFWKKEDKYKYEKEILNKYIFIIFDESWILFYFIYVYLKKLMKKIWF